MYFLCLQRHFHKVLLSDTYFEAYGFNIIGVNSERNWEKLDKWIERKNTSWLREETILNMTSCEIIWL